MYEKLTYSGNECKNYLYFSFDAEYFDTEKITEELNIQPTSVMIKKEPVPKSRIIYGLVWLHGIPHQIAEKNNHPHKSAIHVACWLSVFTIHALWPLVYLWAIMPDKKLAVEVSIRYCKKLHDPVVYEFRHY